MRLTLRTMLAFMDGILEGPDASELEHKIEESKFASDLVHRIRSSMRRLRLGAPKVDGKGMAADANTVAEYLDNTMPPEHFQEFEKVCLESDVHLAEVASSHQILVTLEKFLKRVSNEPALIGGPVRERMYKIGQKTSPPARSDDADGGAARAGVTELLQGPPPAASVRGLMMELPAVPQYPEPVAPPPAGGRFPLKSLAITLLLGFVLAGVALRAIGEFGPNHPVLGFLAGEADTGSPRAAPGSPGESLDSRRATEPVSKGEPDGAAPSLDGEKGAAGSPTVPASEADTANNAEKKNTEKNNTTENNNERTGARDASADAGKESNALRPATPPVAEPTGTLGDVIVETPVPVKPSAPAPAAAAERTEVPPPVPPKLDVAATPINAGMFLSEEQALARLDRTINTWMVVAVNSPLAAGDEFLSLPTFRPQILLASSVKLTIAGAASWKLHVPDAMNIPSITIRHGRATLVPAGEMGGALKMDVGGRHGLLSFADVESAAAIEVRLYSPPGADPLVTPPHVVVALYATSGGLEWKEADRPPVQIGAGRKAAFVDESAIQVSDAGALPDWIDGKNLSDIDRRASQELRKFLTTDRPVSLSLMEQTTYRQVEVRSLACRSLCFLDIFEPALESLGDEQHRSYWHSQYDAIQAAMIQSPESAKKLVSAVQKLYLEQGDTIYRLLRSYSPDELSASGAKELVDNLESSLMTVRVLAFENLRRITGKTLMFRPEERPEQEKSKVANWRKLLESNQISYKQPVPWILPATGESAPLSAPEPKKN